MTDQPHSIAQRSASEPLAPDHLASDELWVLADHIGIDGVEISPYGGPEKINVERLGTILNDFAGKLTNVLAKVRTAGDEYELSEVSVDARLSLDFGFQLIAKGGVEGGITLTFRKKEEPPAFERSSAT